MADETTTEKNDLQSIRLSPSAINTFFRCPRLFYYTYILKKTTPPNIHLYKGTFIHNVLEKVFINTKYIDLKQYIDVSMQRWNPPTKMVKDEIEYKFHADETKQMLIMFANRFDEKMDMLILEGKAKDKNHAWNLMKPKLREHKIFDVDLNLVGIIDSIETSYDDTVYLIDYKTSKLYRHTVPEEYIRQTRIYAYLYYKEFGKLPNYIGIHYIRYGEIYMVPVYPIMIDEVKRDVETVRNKLTTFNKDDYPRCNNDYCDCHYFEPIEKTTETI